MPSLSRFHSGIRALRPPGRWGDAACLVTPIWSGVGCSRRNHAAVLPDPPSPPRSTTMSDLPDRLSQGNTKVTFRARREDARAELKEAIDRKYVHVLFTETQGGTELGFKLDEAQSDLTGADWERGEGTVRLVGDLKL